MSDYRKRPKDEPDDELDFLDWDSPLSPQERDRTSDRPSRDAASGDSARDLYRDPYPDYQEEDFSSARPPASYPPAQRDQDAAPVEQDLYYPSPPPSARRSQRPKPPRTREPLREPAYVPEDSYADYSEEESVGTSAAGSRPRSRTRRQRSAPAISVPRPSVDDGLVVGIMALSLISLVLMIATILAQSGDLPTVFPIHLNANGEADMWGNSGTLWRIPFGVLMSMVMALVVALFLWTRDRFAARFVLAGTLLVQVIAWVAIADFLF